MHSTKLVGILNVTPDSFSDGGLFTSPAKALRQAEKLFIEGADLLDIGGEATNPLAAPIKASDEWNRLKHLVKALVSSYPGKISLDTRHPATARKFLELGGTVLNDVSGFRQKSMIELAVTHQPLCIINHFPGRNPRIVHRQQIDTVTKVKDDLLERKSVLISKGINEANIILDPGIGFGKTKSLNWKLLEFAKDVKEPVMIGHSRKRFLGEERFEIKPNLGAAIIAIKSGASFLRVHEIKPYRKLLDTWSG